MTYLDIARRARTASPALPNPAGFDPERAEPTDSPAPAIARAESAESAESPPPVGALPPDEWTRQMRDSFAPVRFDPPAGCLGPFVCARLGPCDRRAAGRQCPIDAGETEP